LRAEAAVETKNGIGETTFAKVRKGKDISGMPALSVPITV
jgi:hypothetical protein